MAYKTITMYSYKIKNIDGTAQAATLMGNPAPGGFRVTHVILDLTSVSGFVSVPTISLGTNSTSYDDILTATPLTSLTSQSDTFMIPISGIVADIASATGIYLNIITGASASTYTIDAALLGFYDL